MSPLNFESVIKSWDEVGQSGEEGLIHPLRGDEYWASGRAQATEADAYAKPGDTVIDFACGDGRITLPLAKAGYRVIAVDSSQAMLKRTAANAEAEGLTIETIQSDGSDLAVKLGKRKADLILARAVLIHHDYAGVEKIVNGLSKALKKGGNLIADWPVGQPGQRDTWISVTVWEPSHRFSVAERAGFQAVRLANEPSIWLKV